MKKIVIFIFAFINIALAYTNISPADVHARLVAGDSLLLVDVREISEYQAGHIAEPDGMPMIVPARLPLNSKVLEDHYERLPQDIDLVVYCRSGGRSAAASAFLESKGYTQIFNMTGGFSSWSYESRTGEFGDGSGAFVSDAAQTIPSSQSTDVSLSFSENSFAAPVYIELHEFQSAPMQLPSISAQIFYQILALDEFGIPIKFNDQLVLLNSFMFTIDNLQQPSELLTFDGTEWQSTASLFAGTASHIFGRLAAWLALQQNTTHVLDTQPADFELISAYPNPFNSSITIQAPEGADISIYDALGRLITTLEENSWTPEQQIGTGIYLVRIQTNMKNHWHRIVYMK